MRALTALESRLWVADLTARLAPSEQTDTATPSQDALHCRFYSTPAAFRVRGWMFTRASESAFRVLLCTMRYVMARTAQAER